MAKGKIALGAAAALSNGVAKASRQTKYHRSISVPVMAAIINRLGVSSYQQQWHNEASSM